MNKSQIVLRIIAGIVVALVVIGYISRSVTGFYYQAINNSYQQGLIAGAQIDTKPNVCKVKDDYYQFTFKNGNIYLISKNYSQRPTMIIYEFVNMNSYYYQVLIKKNNVWNKIIITMNYNEKTCSVGSAMCAKQKDCNKLTQQQEGKIVDKP